MIDDKTVESILYLCRFNISDKQKKQFIKQIDEILVYFNILEQVDTTNIDPDLGETIAVENLRQDVVKPGFTQEDINQFAIHYNNGFFTIPKIL